MEAICSSLSEHYCSQILGDVRFEGTESAEHAVRPAPQHPAWYPNWYGRGRRAKWFFGRLISTSNKLL